MLHNTYLVSRPMCSFKLLLFTFFLTFWWTKSLLNLCVLWITLWILLCIYNYKCSKCSITNFTFHKMVCIALHCIALPCLDCHQIETLCSLLISCLEVWNWSISLTTYRMALFELRELKVQLQELIDKGFVQPNTSQCGALVLLLKKKDEGMRLCIG